MAQFGVFPTRTAAVVDQIREDIVSRRLRPGAIIRDNEMAERYGVSSSPIREALAQMSAERLVEILPNKTKFVSRIDRKTVHDFLEVHNVLVIMGFTKGAPRLTSVDLENMRRIFDRLVAAGREKDTALFIQTAREFIDPVYRAAGNNELRRQVALKATWLRRMIAMLSPTYIDSVIQGYGLMLSHLENRDIETATLHHQLLLKELERAILALDLADDDHPIFVD